MLSDKYPLSHPTLGDIFFFGNVGAGVQEATYYAIFAWPVAMVASILLAPALQYIMAPIAAIGFVLPKLYTPVPNDAS